ncbi:MAG: hypothetical protein ABSH04_00410 [Acidimicrobiales bacterium]
MPEHPVPRVPEAGRGGSVHARADVFGQDVFAKTTGLSFAVLPG